ncbi:hypothetical protein EH165_01855 [Nakamurella antarctica]|uniref:Metalloprotease n=1 Tax=Nakamurella antarctica TaxID=1902245 RepID=A0A3G8ZJR9_9ACTN|nr:neutral zinc metallopeptidase [Nakamurella antarctica]AZI57095.1 hypothetical protein EH165_01855 [Nakamurella antarctica]
MAAQGATQFRSRAGRVMPAVLATALLLSGCATTISGNASSDPMAVPSTKPAGYTPSSFPIRFALDDGPDQVVRDSLDDINRYYSEFFPQVYGIDFEPLRGGYYSIAPGEGHASSCMDGPNDEAVVDNAFYCPAFDEIAYWRPLVDEFASNYSDLQVALVMAHELGHAIQARVGDTSNLSIVMETQADCFAGTWAKQVQEKKAPHFSFNEENLDLTLAAWALVLPDQVGSDPNDRSAHGSAFDRVSAFQEGYQSGPTACRDDFNDARVFTQQEFSSDNASTDGLGNATYEETLKFSESSLNEYFTTKFKELGVEWKPPTLTVGPTGSDGCPEKHIVSYCPDSNTVLISDEVSLREVHRKSGDYAVLTALGLAYGSAALVQLGYSLTDQRAVSAVSCLTGIFSGEVLRVPGTYGLQISPGDFDEATVLLLQADSANHLVNTGSDPAFDRLDQFRFGVIQGAGGSITACGLRAG